MKTNLTTAILALLCCSVLPAKDKGCTVADFKGTYGFTVTGIIFPGLPISGDFGRLGKVIADGAGKAVAFTLANYNGTIEQADFEGPYTISDSCYLSWLVYLSSLDAYVTFEGVLSGENRVDVIVADPPDAVLPGTMVRQRSSGCKVSDLKGLYAFTLSGTGRPGRPISGRFARFGQVVFDGAGQATATTVASYDGRSQEENFTGTYTVSDDCRLIWNATLPSPSGFATVTEGVISADNRHIMMMMTAPQGSIVLGEAFRQ